MTTTICKHPFIDGCDIPNDKLQSIAKVQSWLKSQLHLPKLTDEHIYLFLHSNYYDIEKTKATILSFFSIRTAAPDVFLNQHPTDSVIQSAFDVVHMVPLPKTTPEGYKVIIFKLCNPDADKFIHINVAKGMVLFNDIRISEDGVVPGYIIVTDPRGFSLTHFTKLSLHVTRVYLSYMQEGKPIRLKGFHIIHSAKIVDKLMALSKPFMKTELQKLIKTHTADNMSEFFKYVPQEIMPEDYGGKAEPMAVLHDKNRKMINTKYLKWVEEEEKLLEEAFKLRIHKKKNGSSTIEEPANSFRNLSID